MQTTSDLYRQLLADPLHYKQIKITVDGVEHDEIGIVSCSTSGGLYTTPGIGNCVSRQLSLAVRHTVHIPIGAEVRVFVRLVAGTQTSEWIPKGIFDVGVPDQDQVTGVVAVQGYDPMMRAEEVWLTSSYDGADWPMPQADAVADICQRMGVALDPRTVLTEAYPVEFPVDEEGDLSMRQVLAYIGVSNGGNWIITDAGMLRLVPYGPGAQTTPLGLNEAMLSIGEPLAEISRINLDVDSEHYYTEGDDLGRTLDVVCPWGTQRMAGAILQAVSGVGYQPYTADDALIDPAAELGDCVSFGDVLSVLATEDILFDRLYTADISAPAPQGLSNGQPYHNAARRHAERLQAQARALITKKSNEIKLMVENAEQGMQSQIQLLQDSITLSVTEQVGEDGEVVAKIELGIGPNKFSGYIRMTGNLEVSGQLSADALYANMGDVADLTVNRLSTSRKVIRYLARDLSDDDFVRVENGEIAFVTGHTDGQTEQASNPNGLPLYWEADPDTCDIGSNGYPYLDGHRVFTTTAVTPWPVQTYVYQESIKRSTYFTPINGINSVIETYGVGDGTGNNRAWIVKDGDGFKLAFRDIYGKDIGITMSYTGFLDIFGQRRTSFLDFSELPFGKFYEMVDGIEREYGYTVKNDAAGRPVQIIDDTSGHVCDVRWWDDAN